MGLKKCIFWSILNWGARQKNSHFFQKGEREGGRGGKNLYKSVRVFILGKKTCVFWSILNWGERQKKCKFLFQKGKGAERGDKKNMHFSGQYLIGTTLKKFSFFLRGSGEGGRGGGGEEEYK